MTKALRCSLINVFFKKLSSCKTFCRNLSSVNSTRVNISYAIYPDGYLQESSTAPIFVLHGLFGSKSNWNSIAKQLVNLTQRQVVALDARNHGESEHHPVMDYVTMSDDLLRVMDKLKVEQAILLGHSMGGKTAMLCALSNPKRVEKLIVEDTAPTASPGTEPLKLYALKMKDIVLPTGVQNIIEARRKVYLELKTFIEKESIRQFLLTNLKQAAGDNYFWRINLDAINNNIDAICDFPKISSTCELDTLFISGSKSDHINKFVEPHIWAKFPKASIVQVDAGHWVHSEKPGDFVHLVVEFIKGTSTKPR